MSAADADPILLYALFSRTGRTEARRTELYRMRGRLVKHVVTSPPHSAKLCGLLFLMLRLYWPGGIRQHPCLLTLRTQYGPIRGFTLNPAETARMYRAHSTASLIDPGVMIPLPVPFPQPFRPYLCRCIDTPAVSHSRVAPLMFSGCMCHAPPSSARLVVCGPVPVIRFVLNGPRCILAACVTCLHCYCLLLIVVFWRKART